jgi:hypothetical protein
MGPEAKAAIPVLQRRLEQTELTELRKIPLRVALANLGFRPAELLAHITVDLDATNCIPTESVQAITLRAMAFSGAKDWVKDDLARHVARLLNAKGDIPFLAILALGAAGTNASVAKDTLARWEAKAPGTIDGGGWQRCLGFARYRVDPAHPSEALRGSLARHGSKNLDHTDGVLLMWMSYVFVDEDLLAQLVAALGDRDDQVRLGVMRFLLFVGRPAAKAAPRLFELTRQSRDEQVRLSAFAALGAIAEQGNVAELEACLRKESEERVQAAIQNAIHLLKHEPVSVSP